jgi:3-dehydroquinate synthetase
MIAASMLCHFSSSTNLSFEAMYRITELVDRVGSIPKIPAYVTGARLVAEMRADKKSREGKIRYVLPEKIGHVRTGVEMPDWLVSCVLPDPKKSIRKP